MKQGIESNETKEKILTDSEDFLLAAYGKKVVKYNPDRAGMEYSTSDKEKLEKKKKNPETRDHTLRSYLLDYIILSNPSWWGESAEVMQPSEFDDWNHHTDVIVEFFDKDGKREAMLAIDGTVSGSSGTLGTKLNQIVDELQEGHLGALKYGPDENGEIKKPRLIENVPRVIIDLTVDGSEVLAKSLATEVRKIKAYEDAVKESKKIYTILNPSLLEEKTQASDNLRMHPIQKSFIDRALMQLKDQLTYLRDKAHKEELNLDEPVQKL
jgi:hypothetical protein